MRIQLKNLACDTFGLINLACDTFCFINNLFFHDFVVHLIPSILFCLLIPLHQKVDPSEGCFGCHKAAFSDQKHIFLKTKKVDQKQSENKLVRKVQNYKNIPECASENSCDILSPKV